MLTQWSPIIDLVTTGQEVDTALDTAFNAVDVNALALDGAIAKIDRVVPLENILRVEGLNPIIRAVATHSTTAPVDASIEIVDDETGYTGLTMIWEKSGQNFTMLLNDTLTGLPTAMLIMDATGNASLPMADPGTMIGNSIATVDVVEERVTRAYEQVSYSIQDPHGKMSKAECITTFNMLVSPDWTKGIHFYVLDGTDLILVKYFPNGDTDATGTAYKFYTRVLEEAI